MSETPQKRSESTANGTPEDLRRGEIVGRLLFLIAGGLLLATMVSCACNPVR